jgi:signal peptide peptidase SppA
LFASHLVRYNATAWAIIPERLSAMLDATGRMVANVDLASPDDYLAAAELAAARQASRGRSGSIARIPISGHIEPKASLWTLLFGGAAVDLIAAQIQDALADRDTSAILLDIDSPGGSVYGIPELARTIRAARGQKPILAVANAEAASAAYYLGSQADEFSITPSGQVGSIGVIYLHTDLTGMAEKQGVKFTIFRSQDRKADANPYEALSEEAAADIQAKVDAYDTMFVRDVARGRGVTVEKVRADFGAGRMFMAREAVKAGLVDREETIDEALRRLASGGVAIRQAPAAAADPRPSPIEVDAVTLSARAAALWEIRQTIEATKEASPCPV